MTPWKRWNIVTLALGAACSPGAVQSGGTETGDDGAGIDLAAVPACEHDVSGWYVTPSSVVSQSGENGEVDYATGAPYSDGITGSVDARDGTLAYAFQFVDGHKYDVRRFEGTGSFEADGDLVVGGTLTTVNRLGVEKRSSQTIAQTGCVITTEIQYEDEDSAYADVEQTIQIVDADTIEGRTVATWNGLDWVEDYTSRSDFTTTYTYTVDDDLYTTRGTQNADGTQDRETTYLSETTRQENVYAYALNGDYSREMLGYSLVTGSLVQEFSAAYAYEGAATGIYRFKGELGEWVTCDFTQDDYDEPDCAYLYDCDNGATYQGEC